MWERQARIIAGAEQASVSGRRLPLWAGWLLALAVAALCAALGFWQLQRMHAKQALLDDSARVLEQRRAQPLALAADPARLKELRQQCKTDRATLGDLLCNRVAEATRKRFYGDGKVPYTPPEEPPKF